MDPPLLTEAVDMEHVAVFVLSVGATGSRPYRRLMRDRDRRKAQMSPRAIRGAATTPRDVSYHIVILRMPGHQGEVWLLFRDTDEYLIAFRNAHGTWFQFYDLAVPANFNPRRLAIKGSHTHMTSGPAANTTVGRFSTLSIYQHLLNLNEHAYGDMERRMLHTSTLMFSEASRFWCVRRLVSFNIDQGVNTVLTDAMWAKIRLWAHISSYVLKCSLSLLAGEAASNLPPFDGTPENLGLMSFSDTPLPASRMIPGCSSLIMIPSTSSTA